MKIYGTIVKPTTQSMKGKIENNAMENMESGRATKLKDTKQQLCADTVKKTKEQRDK